MPPPRRVLPLSPYARARASALLAVGSAAAALAASRAGTPPPTADALVAALGDAVGGVVAPSDVHWEASGGAIGDYLFGRDILFLSAKRSGAPRDVVRARVRVTPEGHVLSVASAHDLTDTPLGDDHALVVDGERAAFATLAYGQEQSVSVLDLSGDRTASFDRLADRVMAWLTNVQAVGSGNGVGRVDLAIERPTKHVDLAFVPGGLSITIDGGGTSVVDPARGEIVSGGEGLHAEVQRHLPKPFVFWAVDTVRAVPWIGPAPVAWLEDQAFALKTALKDAAGAASGQRTEELATTAAEASGDVPPEATKLLEGARATADDAWPPPKVPSIWKKPEPGEGEWVVPKPAWLKRMPGADVPPAFYQTFVRPEADRDGVRVLLVAIDTRQLDLAMEAGSEDPKPLVGAHGPGRLPRDPAIYTRVATAFNGAFKTEHGNYGMMVNKRVLLPPQPNAASVVVLKDGRVGFGTWPNSKEIGGLAGIADGDILSFRQNLDPLLDHGQVDPNKRRELWGFTLPEVGVQTERSGVCVTPAGHVIYAWVDEGSAPAMGRAMRMAGCSYGIHLDMNPHHTGLIFANIEELKGRRYKSELLTSAMGIQADRYIEYAPKDFFYGVLRDPAPPMVLGFTPFEADPGTQPPPAWLPSLWRARGAGVELLHIDGARTTFRVRAGTEEPDGKTGAIPLHELPQDEAAKALMALTLGTADAKKPRGLATGGRVIVAASPLASDALLVTGAGGELSIVAGAEKESVAETADWVELPLLFNDSHDSHDAPDARDPHDPPSHSPVRSGGLSAALGIAADGGIVVARGEDATSAALASALRAAGATRAVLLDRGGKGGGANDRAGGASPLRARYGQSVLYVMAAPMKPRAFRFDPAVAVAAAK